MDDYEAYLAYKKAQGVDSSVTAATSDTSTTVASGYTATIGTPITISIADTNALYASGSSTPITVNKNSIIAVEFTATLNSSAVIGGNGNPNTVTLTYSNNPYDNTDTGTTVADVVYTWTYQLELTKTNASGTALEGAEFKLYRLKDSMTEDKEYAVIDTSTGIVTEWVDDIDNATLLTTDSNGKLNVGNGYIIGLDASAWDENYNEERTITYYLKEITAPTGYNKITGSESVAIEIKPTYTQVTADTDLTVDYTTLSNLTAACRIDGSSTIDYPDIGSISAVANTGTVSATVVNKAGVVLPSTGGIGTTIFYIVGSVLVLLAVVLLITRSRMRGHREE
ncbi:MAG: LPXTG cell wall anchor domain-containing protein [Lachnospiraceae bacterium]|nr:LPXTG cell wall anchor domain-containing protein [Lachnospiraceae bacterium]